MKKSLIRERIVPSVPFSFSFEEPNGDSRTMAFKLAFDLNAFTLFEQVTKINLLAQPGEVFDKPSTTTLSALLWAAMLVNHPEYGPPKDDFRADHPDAVEGLHLVRSLFGLSDLGPAREALLNAFIAQLPKAQREAMQKLKEQGEVGKEASTPLAEEQAVA